MATRIYFHGPGSYNEIVPSIAPAFSSSWEGVQGGVNPNRRFCSPVKRSSVSGTAGNYSGFETSTTSPYDVGIMQFISDRLETQTISGTVKGQFRCYETNADADFCAAVVIRVVSADGQTVRGTLLSYFPGSLTSEWATSFTNRQFPPSTALSEVVCQAGDRLVIEVGFRSFNTHNTYRLGYVHLNDTAATDLPEDETTTTEYAPWMEFSQTLNFINDLLASQVMAQVEHTIPGLIKASQVFVQVEYTPGTEIVATPGLSELALAAFTAQGVNITYRQFPLLPGGRMGQTQPGKRKFPVIV